MGVKYQKPQAIQKERVYVYLDEEEKSLLYEQANENGLSVSAYVSELVRDAFENIIRLPLKIERKK